MDRWLPVWVILTLAGTPALVTGSHPELPLLATGFVDGDAWVAVDLTGSDGRFVVEFVREGCPGNVAVGSGAVVTGPDGRRSAWTSMASSLSPAVLPPEGGVVDRDVAVDVSVVELRHEAGACGPWYSGLGVNDVDGRHTVVKWATGDHGRVTYTLRGEDVKLKGVTSGPASWWTSSDFEADTRVQAGAAGTAAVVVPDARLPFTTTDGLYGFARGTGDVNVTHDGVTRACSCTFFGGDAGDYEVTWSDAGVGGGRDVYVSVADVRLPSP